MQNSASDGVIMRIMNHEIQMHFCGSVCVYIDFGDSYFKASFYPVLRCILHQKFRMCVLSVFSLRFHSELVADWLAVC